MARSSLLVLVVLLVGSSLVRAQPAITHVDGVVGHGQTLTISGTGFGQKDPAAPLLWDDFEAGEVGQPIADASGWQAYSGTGAWYSDGTLAGGGHEIPPHGGHLFACGRAAGPESADGYPDQISGIVVRGFAPGDTLYYSAVTRWDASGAVADLEGRIRHGRILGEGLPYHGPGTLSVSHDLPAGHLRVSHDAGDGFSITDRLTAPQPGRWVRHEMYLVNSTPGTADGAVIVRIHGQEPSSLVREADVMTRASGQAFQLAGVMLGTHIFDVGDDDDLMVSVDDVYVDRTRARVELGDAADLEACTRRTIQIPVAWSDASATVAVNTAGWLVEETGYLFVVDASGRTSAGFEIVVGESSGPDLGPPDAPSSLQVTPQ